MILKYKDIQMFCTQSVIKKLQSGIFRSDSPNFVSRWFFNYALSTKIFTFLYFKILIPEQENNSFDSFQIKWLLKLLVNLFCVLSLELLYPVHSIGKFITGRGNSALNCTRKPISHESRSDECNIGFQVQFNAEFTSQVMNFP